MAAAVVWAVLSWLVANWWILIVLGATAAVGGAVWGHRLQQRRAWDRVRQQAPRYGLPQLDALHHRDFEYAVRDLMLRDGCTDARQIGGAGDNGADVLATHPLGRTGVIQCKHRRDGDRGSPVGTPTSNASTAPPASYGDPQSHRAVGRTAGSPPGPVCLLPAGGVARPRRSTRDASGHGCGRKTTS